MALALLPAITLLALLTLPASTARAILQAPNFNSWGSPGAPSSGPGSGSLWWWMRGWRPPSSPGQGSYPSSPTSPSYSGGPTPSSGPTSSPFSPPPSSGGSPSSPVPSSTPSSSPSFPSSSSSPSSPNSSGSAPAVSNGLSGNGRTTLYWDCAKPACAWPGAALVSSPAKTCDKSGSKVVSADTKSASNGGSAFTCNFYQPWAASDDLSYGFAAFHGNWDKKRTCCACFELTFQGSAIAGKKMIVQVINDGDDLQGLHFDIQVPGGGIGAVNECKNQWNAGSEWGRQYGGLTSDTCQNLPSVLQDGCHWRFNWLQNADNPDVQFKEIQCPSVLTEKSGCIRN